MELMYPDYLRMLPEWLVDKLVDIPETHMGHQIVDFIFKDKTKRTVVVMSCQVVDINALGGYTVEDIVDVENHVSNK